MGRSSIKYIETEYSTKRNLRAVSSPVVYGNFPKYVYAKSLMEKFNKFLGVVLLVLVMLSLVSYYFVSDDEKTMNQIGREIVALTNENIELQNKLDNLHSFNKVDAFIKNNSTLNTAKKIIEIPAVYTASKPETEPVAIRYNWSIGY